ncbi:MAG: MerR family transcriptional regulator [Clostridiales bacterium]|nr:MerR family transcriptional regulator [Clostridiales bacterium]
MMTVREVSRLAGVSVRALHHYDAVGLLKPARVTEAGYRLYDERSLERLQEILLFRELDFPLKEIKAILDDPRFSERDALASQLELLKLRRERLDGVIGLLESMLNKGEMTMDLTVFDDSKEKEYREEAKRRWGGTKAFRESEEKQNSRSREENASAAEGLMALFAKLGGLKALPADSAEAQEAVREIRRYITENYYECTDEIFRSLGQMYAADPRFRENIDRAGGEGTAEFAAKAIGIHCGK